MHSNSNKKRYDSNHMEGSSMSSSQILTNIPSKQSFTLNTHFHSKLSTTSLECASTQNKDEKTISLTAKTKLIYDHFISVRKADTKSQEYLEDRTKNFTLTLSLTEWETLRECLPLFESDERYIACYHLIIHASLMLYQISTAQLQFKDSYCYNHVRSGPIA